MTSPEVKWDNVVSLRAYSEVSKTVGLSINSYGVLFMLEIIKIDTY